MFYAQIDCAPKHFMEMLLHELLELGLISVMHDKAIVHRQNGYWRCIIHKAQHSALGKVAVYALQIFACS